MKRKLLLSLAACAALLPALQGCIPLVATGATVGVLAAIDRRSVGTQMMKPLNGKPSPASKKNSVIARTSMSPATTMRCC